MDLHAYRCAPFARLTASICFLFFGFYAVFFNLEEWAAEAGLGYKDVIPGGPDISLQKEVPRDAVRTFYLLSIMNATSTLRRVCSAYLCDHFGALNVHAVATFSASLPVLLLWTMVKTVPGAIALVVMFGIFSGVVIGLSPALVAYILGPRSYRAVETRPVDRTDVLDCGTLRTHESSDCWTSDQSIWWELSHRTMLEWPVLVLECIVNACGNLLQVEDG